MKKIFIFVFILFSYNLIFALKPGEELIYSIKYGMVTGGYTIGTFTEATYNDTIPCYKITSVSRTTKFFDKFYKVRDSLQSFWDKKKLVTLKYYKQLNEGKYWQKRIQFYYPEQNLSVYWKYDRKTKKIKEKILKIKPNTQDVLTAIYWFRLQNFDVGDTLFVNISSDGKSYTGKIIVLKKEKIKTIFGEKECFVVVPMLKGEATFKYKAKIKIWFTADDKKIPVKMESKVTFGSFKIVLIKAKNI